MVGEDGDLIPPGAFLDAAERFELIGDIDRWVLRRARTCSPSSRRPARSASLEVNLSAVSVGDAGARRRDRG